MMNRLDLYLYRSCTAAPQNVMCTTCECFVPRYPGPRVWLQFVNETESMRRKNSSVLTDTSTYIYIILYIESFVTADSSARQSEVPPIVSASDRDTFASDLGPSTFVSRALSPRVSFPGLRRAYPRAHALGVVRRRRARRPRSGRILRRCFGSTRYWRRSMWCCCCSAMSRS